MKLGVVIPVYNRSKTVLATLDSLNRQTQPPDRVVLVDDGSTDGTEQSVLNWKKRPEVKLIVDTIRTENQGPGAARNIGWHEVSPDCDLVSFLDSDDLWPEDMVAKAKNIVSRKSVGVTDSLVLRDRIIKERRSGKSLAEDPFEKLAGGLKDPGILSTIVVGHDVAKKCMPFQKEFATGQDIPFLLAAASYGAWEFLDAGPVRQNKNDFQTGEDKNLSQKYSDREVLWARAFAHSWHQLHVDLSRRNTALLCDCLRERWAVAAAHHWKNGHMLQAASCMLRSGTFAVKHWSFKALPSFS